MQRGHICWTDLGEPAGSEPGLRRPVVIVSDDNFNRSRIATVIGVAVTSNLRLSDAPGNVGLPASESGLSLDSVVNVSQVVTIDKAELSEPISVISAATMERIEDGLCLVLGLTSPLARR
ncbi:type II toxin-antitoxin system PemK/MazF family toxin [Candidatus Poriferisodalis sp.]|uniref:type II toxin-antitoxin system PemK/MazF family toxin n=1 Tax=Candidatus Poriferisodalis sp. TaxID=3101277 RepID=UPI003B5248AC